MLSKHHWADASAADFSHAGSVDPIHNELWTNSDIFRRSPNENPGIDADGSSPTGQYSVGRTHHDVPTLNMVRASLGVATGRPMMSAMALTF